MKGTTARSASFGLPPVAHSVVEARHHIRDVLGEWGLADLSEVAMLLTSEVVTNSLLHARSRIDLSVEQTATGIRIAVTDGSTVAPAQRPRSTSATTGRGLLLISSLADEWNTEVSGEGKTVWFTLSTGRDPWAAFGPSERAGGAE
jgi:anti-sigma regulatory factor (Ser/Thr protein kinase)